MGFDFNVNEAIDKLAASLGVATDQLASLVPQFAMMKMVDNGIWAVALIVASIALMVFGVRLLKSAFAVKDDPDREADENKMLFGGGMATVSLMAAVAGGFSLVESVKWLVAPEAMFVLYAVDQLERLIR